MEDKPKRALSKWQIYLSGCMKEQPKEKGMGEKVSVCGVEYRHLKDKDPDTLEKIVEKQTKILEAKKKGI